MHKWQTNTDHILPLFYLEPIWNSPIWSSYQSCGLTQSQLGSHMVHNANGLSLNLHCMNTPNTSSFCSPTCLRKWHCLLSSFVPMEQDIVILINFITSMLTENGSTILWWYARHLSLVCSYLWHPYGFSKKCGTGFAFKNSFVAFTQRNLHIKPLTLLKHTHVYTCLFTCRIFSWIPQKSNCSKTGQICQRSLTPSYSCHCKICRKLSILCEQFCLVSSREFFGCLSQTLRSWTGKEWGGNQTTL